MTHADFKIGMRFKTATGEWHVTDIGSRVVIAIPAIPEKADWMKGPPYALLECVFDENDLIACEPA